MIRAKPLVTLTELLVGAGIQPSRRRWSRGGAHELWQFLALMAFCRLLPRLELPRTFTSLITRWFSRRTATAMGIAGGALTAPKVDTLTTELGCAA